MSDWQQRATDYYRQQQRRSGWFELLCATIDGMVGNAGEQESLAFLQQMGDTLAVRHPLPAAATVADLERRINDVLAEFDWGCVDVQPHDNALEIVHLAVPAAGGALDERRWLMAFGAVLQGLYARWLREQGGASHVPLVYEPGPQAATLLFRYQRL